MKTKKCKVCGDEFVQANSMQKVCSVKCAVDLAMIEKEKKRKREWSKEKEEIIDRITTASQWRNILQKLVNSYIRKRDQDKPCISCGKPLKGKFDAGHFYSVGSYPNLRYDEDNIWGQCVRCNRDLHGNLLEYRKNLEFRIGQERMQDLEAKRNLELKLSIPEIKDLIKVYKKKIKAFSNK